MSLAQRCHWARLAIDAVLCGRVFWAETDPHSSLGIMCLVVPTYPSTHRLTAPLDAEEVDHAVMYMLDDIMGKTYLAYPRLRWKLLRTRWLPNWRITNFWWRSAGEGQHRLGGTGAIRNRNEWEGDDLMPR